MMMPRLVRKPVSYYKTHLNFEVFVHLEGESALQKVNSKSINFSKSIYSTSQVTLKMLEKQVKDEWWVVLPGYRQKNGRKEFNKNQSSSYQDSSQNENNTKEQNDAKQKQQGQIQQMEEQFIINDIQLATTGKIKYGESPLNATLREIKQELGLTVQPEQVLGTGQNSQLVAVQLYKSKDKFLIISKEEDPTIKCSPKQIYTSIVKLQKIDVEKEWVETCNEEDDRKKRVQSWVLIRDPHDINFVNRKRKQDDGAGAIVAIISIQNFLKTIKQIKYSWKRTQKKLDVLVPKQKNDMVEESRKKQFKIQLYHNQAKQFPRLSELDGVLPYKNKQQSIETQQKIKEMSEKEITLFIDKIQSYIADLSCHWPGNYIIQVLFKNSNSQQRARIINTLCPKIQKISSKKQGVWTTQQLLSMIDPSKQKQLIQMLFESFFNKFIQVSQNQISFHFARALIKKTPIQLLFKVRANFITNQQNFINLIKNDQSIFIMEDLLKVLINNRNYPQSNQIIKQMVSMMAKNLRSIILTPANYMIHFCYEQLPRKQMKKVTKKIIKHFKIFAFEPISCLILQKCMEKYWESQYYQPYLQELAETLNEEDIVEMYDHDYANRILRRIIKIQGSFVIKDRIVNFIMKESTPLIYDKSRWMYEIKQIKRKYVKQGQNWIYKG